MGPNCPSWSFKVLSGFVRRDHELGTQFLTICYGSILMIFKEKWSSSYVPGMHSPRSSKCINQSRLAVRIAVYTSILFTISATT
jgi:hypothetical protein